jgi:IS4 transposase
MKQPNPLPPADELAKFKVERMVLVKRRRAIFRHWRHGTIVVVERDDHWWHIDRLERGRVIASRIVKRLPPDIYELVTGRRLPPWLREEAA